MPVYILVRELECGGIFKKFLEYVYKNGETKKFIDDFESGRIVYLDKDSLVYHLYEFIRCFRDFVEGLNDVRAF